VLQRPLLPSSDEDQQEQDGYGVMVHTIAFSAKAYWAMWGPLGQPMIDGVDRWAERTQGYLQPVRNGS
jgi:hypothetical protein